jgi:D-alanyl-D-alanine carboxypeptidase
MSPSGKKLWVIACLALVLAAAGTARAEQLTIWTRQALQQALQTAVRGYHLAGAAALVRSPSGETRYGAAGWAHAPRGVPRGVADHNGIGSVTKTFTSTLALQLVEEGRLGLADTVEEVLPGLLSVGAEVTVRDLLLMQSGLQHYEEQPEMAARVEADPLHRWRPRELARLADGLAFPPGEGFDYNNVNYVILGMMVAELDGRPWEESLRRRILGPLGLENTGVLQGDLTVPPPRAVAHACLDGRAADATRLLSPSVAGAAGAMYSNLDDMLRWMDAFWSGRLLGPEMQSLRRSLRVAMSPDSWFGMGYAVRASGASGFSGSFNGWYTAEWQRLEGWSLVVLSNGQAGEPVGPSSSAKGAYDQMLRALGLAGS